MEQRRGLAQVCTNLCPHCRLSTTCTTVLRSLGGKHTNAFALRSVHSQFRAGHLGGGAPGRSTSPRALDGPACAAAHGPSTPALVLITIVVHHIYGVPAQSDSSDGNPAQLRGGRPCLPSRPHHERAALQPSGSARADGPKHARVPLASHGCSLKYCFCWLLGLCLPCTRLCQLQHGIQMDVHIAASDVCGTEEHSTSDVYRTPACSHLAL